MPTFISCHFFYECTKFPIVWITTPFYLCVKIEQVKSFIVLDRSLTRRWFMIFFRWPLNFLGKDIATFGLHICQVHLNTNPNIKERIYISVTFKSHINDYRPLYGIFYLCVCRLYCSMGTVYTRGSHFHCVGWLYDVTIFH